MNSYILLLEPTDQALVSSSRIIPCRPTLLLIYAAIFGRRALFQTASDIHGRQLVGYRLSPGCGRVCRSGSPCGSAHPAAVFCRRQHTADILQKTREHTLIGALQMNRYCIRYCPTSRAGAASYLPLTHCRRVPLSASQ